MKRMKSKLAGAFVVLLLFAAAVTTANSQEEPKVIDLNALATKGEAIADATRWPQSSAVDNRTIPLDEDSISEWPPPKDRPCRGPVNRKSMTPCLQPSSEDLTSPSHSRWSRTETLILLPGERLSLRWTKKLQRPAPPKRMSSIGWDSISRRGYSVTRRWAQKATPSRGLAL